MLALPKPRKTESIRSYIARMGDKFLNCGDTLFVYILRDLADCDDDLGECLLRLEHARGDIEHVEEGIRDLLEV